MSRWIPLLLVLAAPSLAHAQPGSVTRIGLGIRLGTSSFVSDGGSDIAVGVVPRISVPIDVNGIVRIEPEIGIVSLTFDGGSFDSTVRQTELGLAVSALVPRDDLTLTLGARARYLRSTSEFSGGGNSQESTSTGLSIGPVVGGEYPFSARFAMGAEVGVEYQSYEFDASRSSDGITGVSTTAALSARFFF